MDVMLDFICMGPVDLSGAHRKQQNKKKRKILARSETRTHNPQQSDSRENSRFINVCKKY